MQIHIKILSQKRMSRAKEDAETTESRKSEAEAEGWVLPSPVRIKLAVSVIHFCLRCFIGQHLSHQGAGLLNIIASNMGSKWTINLDVISCKGSD